MPQLGPLMIKAQMFRGEEIAMGPGKADLLEAIAREGSISAAGRTMGMSYRRAWLMVDTMNRCWRAPLVASTPGSGARVTAMGTSVLAAYRALEAAIAEAAGSTSLEALREMLAPGA